ncbi:DNA recombination protein RmuC [Aquimarina sp. ERC-38]|uniref:DNA recombination protein RmuC n=1 Tax=Aquimarina sp. ERC-38 TaxID=2949996 RepID=UPI0022455FD1|nr:DNA recombination protein RmuC [Aquimarina sp. ERC-38]UZO80782.1 DNA recombination protein RmuC [Aquimarina sp. ERC-38]
MLTSQTLIYLSIALVIGIILGYLIHLLKSQSIRKILEERNLHLQKQLEELKTFQTHQLHTLAEQHGQYSAQLEKQLTEIKTDREGIRREKDFLQTELARKNSEFDTLKVQHKEQKEEVANLQKRFSKEFENLANRILEEKSIKFTAQNKENLQHILHPLQEKIKLFENKVDQTHKESIDYHAALRQQIVGLREVNLQMSKETLNLTKALKGDSKLQGNWGELVLERVLEKSGLEKDREYFVQKSFTREDGTKVLPDVVIYLPDKKRMIVDSKVSLTAYEKYVNQDDELLKTTFLKQHLISIKKHVDQLSSKSYEDLYETDSPDFVLLFIPIEPAFALAINSEPSLYNQAFEKNIVIVTPATLLATLRTIDTMWNNEKQQQNAIEIARQAGALYDKFTGLLTDLERVGKRINDSKGEYDAAMKKLSSGRGNLIQSADKLKKMGAKAKKSVPETWIKKSEEDLFD